MKNKGFTLIELLAVIIILSVVTLITVPMITNVIEESKKKALASSVEGLVESANLYAIENDGVYEFLFDKEHKGSTKKGESLDYRGTIDEEGKLYLDNEGNVSVCISNDTYYAYKNYNSGIIVGDKKTGNCIIGFDALTNKYVAMLDNGTGNVSNVYSKDEINNLIDNLANTYATKEELNNNMNNLSSMITANQASIDDLNGKLQEWKHLKTVTGKTEVALPEIYSELFVIAKTSSDESNAFSFFIPKISLSDNLRYFTNGYAIYVDTNYGHFVRIGVSKTKIALTKYAQSIGSTFNDVSSKAIVEVYYK